MAASLRARRLVTVVALALVLLSILARPVAAQAPGSIEGDLPADGFALVTWSGGAPADLVAVAAGEGCTVRSIWVAEGGRLAGYIEGAPAAVNRAFADRLPGGEMGPGPVIVVCRPPSTARAIEGTGCTLFPDSNPWAMRVDGLPLHPNSDGYIDYIMGTGGTGFLHADFGSNPDYGIPFVVVPPDQPRVPISFDYNDESDPGPYPIPANAPVEAGSDRHILVVQDETCVLYEVFAAERQGSGWSAGSGAIFDLKSNRLRPAGWTSADAAGLPIFAGLARYEEVDSGAVEHALRVTFRQTQRGYISPARHFASSITEEDAPPMGLRLRLRDDFDLSGYRGHARVLLETMRDYGLIVADNGSNWYISGATDARWDDDDLNQLKTVPGNAFEVVDTGPIQR